MRFDIRWLLVFLTLLIIGCNPTENQGVVKPVLYCGDGYCNNNEDCNSCNSDCGDCPKKYKEFTVKAYVGKNTVRPQDVLPVTDEISPKTITLNKFNLENGFYIGSWLALYTTDYDVEPIRCEVKEYYDGKLNNQFTLDLIWLRKGLLEDDITLGYEQNIQPNMARYDYTCKGTESNEQFSGSYSVHLRYE